MNAFIAQQCINISALSSTLTPSTQIPDTAINPPRLSQFLHAWRALLNLPNRFRNSSRCFPPPYLQVKVGSLAEQIVKQRPGVQEKVPALFQVLRL